MAGNPISKSVPCIHIYIYYLCTYSNGAFTGDTYRFALAAYRTFQSFTICHPFSHLRLRHRICTFNIPLLWISNSNTYKFTYIFVCFIIYQFVLLLFPFPVDYCVNFSSHVKITEGKRSKKSWIRKYQICATLIIIFFVYIRVSKKVRRKQSSLIQYPFEAKNHHMRCSPGGCCTQVYYIFLCIDFFSPDPHQIWW